MKGGDSVAAGERGTYTAEVELPLEELKFPRDLFYVFTFQIEGRRADFVIISRARLDDLRLTKDLGFEHVDQNTGTQSITFTFSFSNEALTCGEEPFDDYRNAWTTLPPLAHLQA